MFTLTPAKGVDRVTLCHPITIPPTRLLSLSFRMAAPRRSNPSLYDPLRRSPRHFVRRVAPSHRIHLLHLPTAPVWDSSSLERYLSYPHALHIAPRVGFSQWQAAKDIEQPGAGRDDATARVEHVPRAYDARDRARHPRRRLSRVSPRAG